jgi:hypothetical protein
MVRKGNFELKLVYADTKMPFKEHPHIDGRVYAEVEPNAEYYLQARSHHPKPVVLVSEVDGKTLGYQCKVKRGDHGWMTTGLWHRQENWECYSALKFQSLYRRPNRHDNSERCNNGHWTGFVTLKAYEYVPNGHKFKEKEDFESTWYPDTETIANGLNMSENKKACLSVEGSVSRTRTRRGKKKVRNYKVGPLIESITLHYCSTNGLIAAKVLAPPVPTIHNDTRESSTRPSKRQRSDSSEPEGYSHVVQSKTIERTYDVVDFT